MGGVSEQNDKMNALYRQQKRLGYGPDQIKMMAMQMAIDRCRGSISADLFVLASSIESFLRGGVVPPKQIPVDLLMRAEAFIGPAQATEFSERNFTAALTLIGDMASYLKEK